MAPIQEVYHVGEVELTHMQGRRVHGGRSHARPGPGIASIFLHIRELADAKICRRKQLWLCPEDGEPRRRVAL
jgi:hypothetical protein